MSRCVLHFDCDNMPATLTGAHLACVFSDRNTAVEYARDARGYSSERERVKTTRRTIRVEGATLTVWVVTWRSR